MSIRNRLLLILALIGLSVFYLVPRNVTVRERDLQTGVMRDHTEKRVPLKLGLDLQGGMHLALELDQSKQVSAEPSHDLDLALTVLRKRIDEFGVSEPVIQKVGSERIVLELPGIDEPARAKGIGEWSVILRHALRNGAIPIVTALGLELGNLLGGAVITEAVFAYPGIGRLAVEAVINKDVPLIQAVVFVVATIFVVVNFLADLAYMALDPRIRLAD